MRLAACVYLCSGLSARMYQKGERRSEEILRATLRVIGAHGPTR